MIGGTTTDFDRCSNNLYALLLCPRVCFVSRIRPTHPPGDLRRRPSGRSRLDGGAAFFSIYDFNPYLLYRNSKALRFCLFFLDRGIRSFGPNGDEVMCAKGRPVYVYA